MGRGINAKCTDCDIARHPSHTPPMMSDTKDTSPRATTPVQTPQYASSEEATLALDAPSPLVGSPPVDLEYASTLKPSRLQGRRLMFMITFIAGTGVSLDPRCSMHGLTLSSRCLGTTKAF